MFCVKCRNVLKDQGRFCTRCGAPRTEVNELREKWLAQSAASTAPTNKKPTSVGKRALIVVGGLFVLGLIIAGANSNGSTETASATTTASTTSTASTPTAASTRTTAVAAPHKIGEGFAVGYWGYRCDGAHWQQTISGEAADASFLVIDMSIINNDTTASTLPPMKLVDAQGREYDEAGAGMFLDRSFGILKDVNPGVTSRGRVAFDVPRGEQYKLKVSGGFQSDAHAAIDLSES